MIGDEPWGLTGRSPLFCTLEGRPLHASHVRTLLHRLGDKAGINKRVHPHALRHSMAYELMWEGVPVPIIQAQLGHGSLAPTQQYLNHLAPKELVDTMQRRESEVELRSPQPNRLCAVRCLDMPTPKTGRVAERR